MLILLVFIIKDVMKKILVIFVFILFSLPILAQNTKKIKEVCLIQFCDSLKTEKLIVKDILNRTVINKKIKSKRCFYIKCEKFFSLEAGIYYLHFYNKEHGCFRKGKMVKTKD